MKATGIICEYNPFHTGHAHQINEIKKKGDAIVCLMSGHITERGEFAIADKYTRAACAIRGGADLVLELPFPYCSSSAEFFADAGVGALISLGVDEINFGSENGDRDALLRAARLTSSEKFDAEYRKKLADQPNLGAAQAYFMTCRDMGISDELLSNDILGVSYFKVALKRGFEEKLTVIRREGSAYSEAQIENGKHPSATALRRELRERGASALDLMPTDAKAVLMGAINDGLAPTDSKKLTSAYLSFFRLAEPRCLSEFAEASGGLADRLCAAAAESTTLDEFFDRAAAKRYTDSRVRRAAINCMLGVKPDDLRAAPAYLLLLAANEKGRKLLASIRKSAEIPIVTKPADADSISSAAARQSELSRRVDALFCQTLPKEKAASEYIKRSPFIDFLEND
jgi:predicted nucleotidyltransferase